MTTLLCVVTIRRRRLQAGIISSWRVPNVCTESKIYDQDLSSEHWQIRSHLSGYFERFVCFQAKTSIVTLAWGTHKLVPMRCNYWYLEKWSPALQIRTVLLSIQALLSAPNPDDPLANDVAEQWKNNEVHAIDTGMFSAKTLTRPSTVYSFSFLSIFFFLNIIWLSLFTTKRVRSHCSYSA